jgi:hypothetical protein
VTAQELTSAAAKLRETTADTTDGLAEPLAELLDALNALYAVPSERVARAARAVAGAINGGAS